MAVRLGSIIIISIVVGLIIGATVGHIYTGEIKMPSLDKPAIHNQFNFSPLLVPSSAILLEKIRLPPAHPST